MSRRASGDVIYTPTAAGPSLSIEESWTFSMGIYSLAVDCEWNIGSFNIFHDLFIKYFLFQLNKSTKSFK